MKNIKRLIAISIMSTSIFAISPIVAHAEWKQDSNGWWNTEGNSWSTGWKEINGKWYYFGQDGYMAHDTEKDGYRLGSDGAWTQNIVTTTTTTNSNNTTNLNSNNVTTTNLTSNSNNMTNSNNLTNMINNINNGIIINGNVAIGNTTTNPNNSKSKSDNYNNPINSNDYNKTEPIIEGKFTDKENSLFPCWAIIGGKYYHLDEEKRIDYNTTIDGYEIGVDGAWIQDDSIIPPKAIVLPYGFQLNAQQIIQKLQMEAKRDEVRQDLKSEKHNSRMDKIKELQGKIEDVQNKHTNNGDYWIQIYENKIRELQLEDQADN